MTGWEGKGFERDENQFFFLVHNVLFADGFIDDGCARKQALQISEKKDFTPKGSQGVTTWLMKPGVYSRNSPPATEPAV